MAIANTDPVSRSSAGPRMRPVVGARLRRLLVAVFGLFGLLAINSLYLASITWIEWISGEVYQDHFYQLMFLAHLVFGLLLILPFVPFGALHLRNAWRRPNRRAVAAGLSLYSIGLILIISGLVLTRFDFFEVKDPDIRSLAYWTHLITPLLVIWLFVLHRLAGRALRWKTGAAWATAALAATAVLLLVQKPGPEGGPQASREVGFEPSLAQTANGGLIAASALMMDGYCEQCHADIHGAWEYSAHRFSSFNNPAYRFSVNEVRDLSVKRFGDARMGRFCAGCHDLVPLFSGAFDDPDFDETSHPTADAGITCTGCHAITRIDSLRGNADYTIAAPEHYPFTFSDNAVLKWLNHQLIRAKPAFHKKTFLKPLHRQAEFCGTCHKVFLPAEVNDYKWLRGQNHFDSFMLSGVSGHGASSFYYPPKAVTKCAECHMPLQASGDFGAAFFDASGELKVHDHQFVGANTALPHLLGMPERTNHAHQGFLAGALRVDIFGLKEGGRITSPLIAPLRPEIPALKPGKAYLLETVIRTLKPGHLFTQGTADSNQVWLDLVVRAGERVIGRSGDMSPEGEVDPWSHFVNAYLLDRNGNRIDRRNGQDIFTALYNHQVPPGAADVVHYAFSVPEDARSPIVVEVELKYRKFDTTYMRYFQGEQFVGNDLPVTVLARDRVVFPVHGGSGVTRAQTGLAPPWERWNDYGIALLRKGQRGELRQAETAFAEVERLGSAQGALNLARVYLREGRLDEAVSALERASGYRPAAYPWVVAWLTGLVNKQNGYLDEAIADFRRVIATDFAQARARGFDFSRDYRVLNELGQTLVERAKQERGEARRQRRNELLEESVAWFEKVLGWDPENVTAHFNLALVNDLLGEPDKAATHRRLHEKYRPDDNAGDRAVAMRRRNDPAADKAAEAVVIYDLQRQGSSGLSRMRGPGISDGVACANAPCGQASPGL